jgi:hypothetical protein
MKKTLLTFFLLFLAVTGFSQKYLTIRQVYNFNVGDMFESEMGSSGHPGTYYLRVILSKSFSSNNDTLFYTDSVYSYRSKSCMTCTDSSFSSSVENYTIPNLDSIAGGPLTANTSCSKYYVCHNIDTLEPFCTTSEFISKPDLSCTGLDSCGYYSWQGPTTSYIYKGCPDFYYNFYDYTAYTTDYYSLTYYKKSDTTCGGLYDIRFKTGPVSTQSLSLPASFNLYPNPATSQLNVSTNQDIHNYDITDLAGRIVTTGIFTANQAINIESLSTGQYLLKFYSENSGCIVKKFCKE